MNRPLEFSAQDHARYQEIFTQCEQVFDEKSLRLLAAAMVLALGYGGQKVIRSVPGLSPDTLPLGETQWQGRTPLDPHRIRRPGGGRKPITAVYLSRGRGGLIAMDGRKHTGDPESPRLWTTKSLDHLARALAEQGMPISRMTVSHAMRVTLLLNPLTMPRSRGPW